MLEEQLSRKGNASLHDPPSHSHRLRIYQRYGTLFCQKCPRYLYREAAAKTIDPRGDRYRVDNARFYREEMGTDLNELGIDPSGTFKKMGPKAPSSASTAAARGPGSGASFGSVRPPNSSAVPEDPAKKPRVSTNRTPIILVPGARDMSSLVNLANFPLLLREKTFRPAMDIVKEGKAPTGSQVKHQRRSRGTGETVDYLLVANVRQLSANDWDRVVAIVCSGAEWQFKVRYGSFVWKLIPTQEYSIIDASKTCACCDARASFAHPRQIQIWPTEHGHR
mmetsp:Transcript_15666/g.63974  ORF Transcript_15666/g.63974 Transcript_15666/m.63974 type:complete len:279 (+) Transcript_15666:1076-1912(+)